MILKFFLKWFGIKDIIWLIVLILSVVAVIFYLKPTVDFKSLAEILFYISGCILAIVGIIGLSQTPCVRIVVA